jgi:hypothetical protein
VTQACHLFRNFLEHQGYLENHKFPSPQAPLSRQQNHVIQACHFFRDFQEYLGYLENRRSPEKTNIFHKDI